MPSADTSPRNQTAAAELGLRELILQGRLRAGERLVETDLVARLGVSRTPVRAALTRLEGEGLVVSWPGGGYAVASFSRHDVADAIEVRGTLEGMAARLAAQNGLTRRDRAVLRRCTDELDEAVAGLGREEDPEEPFVRYVELNERFHAALVDAAGNRMLRSALDRVLSLPFAAPSALVSAQAYLPKSLELIAQAQRQHRAILAAIEAGDPVGAETLARDHARVATRNLDYALADEEVLRTVAGAHLIDKRS